MKIVSVHYYGYINDALNKQCNFSNNFGRTLSQEQSFINISPVVMKDTKLKANQDITSIKISTRSAYHRVR